MALCAGCTSPAGPCGEAERPAAIFPDYAGTVVPHNIAPLNFRIGEDARRFTVTVTGGEGGTLTVKSRDGLVRFPARAWRRLLDANKDRVLTVRISAKTGSGTGVDYPAWSFTVSSEPIDPYLVYRLIEPGYEVWGWMGIYQRELASFAEAPIMTNRQTGGNCMNCHSFAGGDPETMLFHMRQKQAGTVFLRDGAITKVDTKLEGQISAGVYPRWHPNGRVVAFSVNDTSQSFHTSHPNVLEVYDKASDIILWDVASGTAVSPDVVHADDRFETQPEWSPDGRWLYFCSARAVKEMPAEYKELKYDLFRVSYDPETGTLSDTVDTLFVASKMGRSAAFPRVSPDGRHVAFCISNYGAFPIWQRDSDIWIVDVETRRVSTLEGLNSPQAEGYHSWSSAGGWMVLGSRRGDGLYTRPYIARVSVGADGGVVATRPFLLPLRDPVDYDLSMKSYNVPEFVRGRVPLTPKGVMRAIE
jgi:hypothetical protein